MASMDYKSKGAICLHRSFTAIFQCIRIVAVKKGENLCAYEITGRSGEPGSRVLTKMSDY
jgi:hypothetical protein